MKGEHALRATMAAQGIAGPVFEMWLKEEHQYLQNLQDKPVEDTNEIDYYMQLVKFYECEYVLLSSLVQLNLSHVW